MKYNLYTIYDRVAEESAPPFAALNDAVAARMFRALMNDEGIVSSDLNDYQLVKIAEYDTSLVDGQISLVEPYSVDVLIKENKE